MSKLILVISAVFFSMWIVGQEKKRISTDAYKEWKGITDESISDNGVWASFKEVAYRGNDTLSILKEGVEKYRFGRVNKIQLDPEAKYVVFTQSLDYDSIRQLKIKKVKKKDWPLDSLAILLLERDTTYWFEKVDKFQTGESGDWIVVEHNEKFKLDTEPKKEEKKCWLKRKKQPEKIESKVELGGSVVSLFNKTSQETITVEHVTEATINELGDKVAMVKDKLKDDTLKVSALYFGTAGKMNEIFEVKGVVKNLQIDRSGNHLGFMVSEDTTENKRFRLYLYDASSADVQMILDTVSKQFKSYQSVADSRLTFNENGDRLFFKVGQKPLPEKKDTVPEDEMAKLDVWSWTDGRIQPQQLKSAKKDALGEVDFVFNLNGSSVAQISDTSLQNVKYQFRHNGEYVMLSDQAPYEKEMTWDFWYFDVYRVSLIDGSRELLGKKLFGWDYDLSPSGRYFTYWNSEDSSWYLKDLDLNKERNITKSIPDDFFRRDHDVPSKIDAEGKVYWLDGETACAIEGQDNFWIVPMEGKPYTFTKQYGKEVSFSYLKLNEEERYINLVDGFYLKGFDHRTKSESIFRYGENGMEKLGEWDAKLMSVKQAKDKGSILFEKMSFKESYNLFLTDKFFTKTKQITDLNRQQQNYFWGDVNLFSWKDYKGDSVSGLLYTPEYFDPSGSYPLIVYYYERYTDNLHFYYRPKPTASIIFPTEYISNGYVVFIPDITYETGQPADGAYNAIMSGTDAILKAYPNIDSLRMGLQGQSWGGYQTAQMITMTKRYKCAMAGAPVSNMFSAYGGIRWGSGLSRTFQYETGQSRIGATIWEAPELYIKNSPLFHLPKVETPLLIMHNDGDGAVPWYQGIELYNGLRRLDKPVWLLNYNDDEHNLMKDANRMDLSIRMRQFFDFYLLGSPQPKWMENGVPATMKGMGSGLE